jgi:hypothetical protein
MVHVHLRPIPSDAGCAEYFGTAFSTLDHQGSLDLKYVATALNKKCVLQQPAPLPPAQGGSAQSRAVQSGQGRNPRNEDLKDFEELHVTFPPAEVQNGADVAADVKGQGLRFVPAVPIPQFEARVKAAGAALSADAVRSNFRNMTKCQKQKARLRCKLARDDLAQYPSILSPGDIPRARFFLCYHADVLKDGQLPAVHIEIDPSRPLAESIDKFDAVMQVRGKKAARSNQTVAIFYGSGEPFSQCHVPGELQWSVASLDAGIQNGRILVLDVVAAIKSAMPLSWLVDHGMASDHLCVAFSKSRQEILDVYAAALFAWGAADVLEPAVHTGARRCTSGPQAAKSEQHDDADALHRAQLLLDIMESLSNELVICANSDQNAELSIDCLEVLQSDLASTVIADSFRNSRTQTLAQFSSHLPQVLNLSSRILLFRQFSGVDLADMMKLNRVLVLGVDRARILDWAASIADAIRGRRNPLYIQVH